MNLTPQNKIIVDGLSYFTLLARWRFAPAGDVWFQGETGKYWSERMQAKKMENPGAAVQASKDVGWDRP